MKKQIFTILALLLSHFLLAQDQGKWSHDWSKWDYDLEKQNLYKKKYFINLDLLNMEMSSNDGFRLAGDIKIYANPIKRIWAEGSYSKAYFSFRQFITKDCKPCENKFKTHGKGEIGARFSFVDNIVFKKEKVAYSTTHTGTHTITKYGVYRIPKRSIFAVRGGFYTLNHMISTEWLDEKILEGKLTNYKNTGVYGGLSFSRIVNTKFENVRGNKTHVGYFNDYYLDVIYSLSESVDALLVNGKAQPVVLNSSDENSFQTGNLGFRFGYNALVIRKLVNISFGTEISYFPGVKNNLRVPVLGRRVYAGFKAGMSFSF